MDSKPKKAGWSHPAPPHTRTAFSSPICLAA